MKSGLYFTISGLLIASASVRSETITSIYTNLQEDCKTVEMNSEEDWSVQSCPGVAGYSLLVEYSDARESVTVVAPNKIQYPLNYSEVISSGFSNLGTKAEWRIKKVDGIIVPIALIVRVNASENSEDPSKKTSYLAVSKISDDSICVTDKIGPISKANEAARRAADQAFNKACIGKAP
jgi:hypothetical protein